MRPRKRLKVKAAGLKGVRLNQEGEMGYFGIAGTNATDTEANLPFLRVRAAMLLAQAPALVV